MSDTVSQLIKRIETLELETRFLKALKNFAHLDANSIVGAEYVAKLYGCSEEAVKRGRAGTLELRNRRVRKNPDGWLKREVDAVHKRFVKPAIQRAIEAEGAANERKRK